MLREFRRVWCEDQYRVVGTNRSGRIIYCSRKKGGKTQFYKLELGTKLKARRVKIAKKSEIRNSSNKIQKIEHVLKGHAWKIFGRVQKCHQGLENLSKNVKSSIVKLPTGASATFLIPRQPKSWVVSLHGGPESHEGLEIRYGGFYRKLLREEVGIILLNYVGSTNPNLRNCLCKPAPSWGRWKDSICQDYIAVQRHLHENGLSTPSISLLGVSFGGALALILHKEFSIEKTVLLSPLLDLSQQRRRGGRLFRNWFNSRFLGQDWRDLSFSSLTEITGGRIFVQFGKKDEVLGNLSFRKLKKINPGGGPWILSCREGGHVPQTYSEYQKQREFLNSCSL